MSLRPIGYVNKLSLAPGEPLEVMVSSRAGDAHIDFVRMRRGIGPSREHPATEPVDRVAYPCATGAQLTHTGSFICAPGAKGVLLDSFSLALWLWVRPGRQPVHEGLLAKWDPVREMGIALLLEESGVVSLSRGDGDAVRSVALSEPVRAEAWHFLFAAFDAGSGKALLRMDCVDRWAPAALCHSVEGDLGRETVDRPDIPWTIGCQGRWEDPRPVGRGHRCFSGKLDTPRVWATAAFDDAPALAAASGPAAGPALALHAAWDLGGDVASPHIVDQGPHGLTGVAVNTPARAVTGHLFSGEAACFGAAPTHYTACHFHRDDLTDAGWVVGLEWTVPREAQSGVYAARIQDANGVDHVPFVVVPGRGVRARALVVLPTLTYLAYANARRLGPDDDPRREHGWVTPPDKYDQMLDGHPEFGRSLYDLHDDGSEVMYASWRRPLLNMRADAIYRAIDGPRHFAADLFLMEWLTHIDVQADVITDRELHEDGAQTLADYRVVITGSHPEYCTSQMLDSLECFVDGGGQLMYLGGNGFEAVAAVSPNDPAIMEIRRGPASGRRSPQTAETHLSFTGELGGLWRNRGRSPHRLVGVGTAAIGQDTRGRGYARLPAGFRQEAEFIFAGIAPGEMIGGFGLAMGGAAGDELDRAAPEWGTPPETLRVASASGFSDSYRVIGVDQDEVGHMSSGTAHHSVRSDMVLLTHPSGGRVFAVGSVSWIAALPIAGFENNIARVTENVLREFMREPRGPS